MAGMLLAVALCAFIQPAVAGSWRATKVLQGPFAASSPPEAPVLATNDKGHTVAVFNPTGLIRFAEHIKGGHWSNPVTVVANAAGNATAVAIGADETTAVAWTTVGTRYVPSKLVVSIREPGGQFSPPSEVGPGTGVWYPKLGIAGDGSVTLLWSAGTQVYSSHHPVGGAWSAPVTLRNSVGINLPDLAVNNVGVALAVWQEGASNNPTAIYAAYRAVDGAWQAPQQVSAGTGLATWNPKPGLDAQGNATVGYLDGTAMWVASSAAGGVWTAPTALSSPQVTAYYPALALNANGDVLAAWQAYDATGASRIQARTKPANAAWGAMINLSTRNETPGWPNAALSNDGLGIVSWVDDSAQAARAAVLDPAGTWRRSSLGAGWWGLTVSVAAGGGSIGTGWALPNPLNPNAARLVGRIYE